MNFAAVIRGKIVRHGYGILAETDDKQFEEGRNSLRPARLHLLPAAGAKTIPLLIKVS